VGGWPFPGRESHPLDAPGFPWRTEELLDIDFDNPFAPLVEARRYIANGLVR